MGNEQPIKFATEMPPMVDLDALRDEFPCPTCMGIGFLGFFSAMQGKACSSCDGSGIELPAQTDNATSEQTTRLSDDTLGPLPIADHDEPRSPHD